MSIELAPGDYMGRILSHQIAKASTGNQQLAFTVEVTGEIDSDDPNVVHELDTPKRRTVFRTITPKTVERLVKELRILGYKGKGFSQLDQSSCAKDEFVDLSGLVIPLRCSENNYNGNQNERWDFNFQGLPTGPVLERAEASAVRALDAEYADLFESEPEHQESAPTKTQAPPANKNGVRKGNKAGNQIPF